MRLTKEELIEKFKTFAGENVTSDAAIELLEDISDSVEVEEVGEEEGEDWEAKYKELDETWRKKYAERFSEPGEKEEETEEKEEETEEETEEERAENVTYEDLFEEKKKKED